jgi:SAM-dependent methyltransferase
MDDVVGYYRAVAPFYDAELRVRGDEGFWTARGCALAGRAVLEIGAGSGRATALVAPGGARVVVALDLSPDMLARAAARRTGALLLRGDMRDLPCRGGAFNAVVSVNDPFSHLTEDADRAAALAEAARVLAPGGLLVFDALWIPPAERACMDGAERIVDCVVETGGRRLGVRSRWRHAPAAPYCLATYEYALDGHPAARASFHGRYWTEEEVAGAFAAAGFAVERCWGDYQGSPWHPGSPRLVVEARKV